MLGGGIGVILRRFYHSWFSSTLGGGFGLLESLCYLGATAPGNNLGAIHTKGAIGMCYLHWGVGIGH